MILLDNFFKSIVPSSIDFGMTAKINILMENTVLYSGRIRRREASVQAGRSYSDVTSRMIRFLTNLQNI